MRIQHNIMAMNSYRNYTNNTKAVSKNLEKLSSGYRINRAGDDAAGLAISEKMRAQITGLKTAEKNAKDGISLVQTAEGALTEVHSMLNRMAELADQSANGTYDNEVDRANLQKEVSALNTEIDRIADSSNFNGIKLLDGSLAGGAKGSGMIGSTKVSFELGVKDATIFGANEAKVTFADGAAVDKGINVAFDDGTGAMTITLGTKTAETYSADQITAAVRAAAASYAGGATTNAAAIGKAYAGFTMNADGPMSAAAAGSLTMAQATMTDGTGEGLTLQIGDTAETFNKLSVSVGDMHTASLGINLVDVGTQAGASDAIAKIKNAINSVSSTRGDLGATQNRLDHTINNLSVMRENIQDAESSIRDVDVAEEMMAYTKNNILVQSAQAMLAQANQAPQGVLQLLQ